MTAQWPLLITLGVPLLAGQRPESPTKPTPLMEISTEMHSLTQRVSPAVVQIEVTGYGPFSEPSHQPISLFGRQESTGSGVIVDTKGYIVTNAHVVEGAVSIRVLLANSHSNSEHPTGLESVDASIVGVDSDSDLAVLKVQKEGLRSLRFMNSDHLRQGDLILAIGAPMGLRNSVSLGVVSSPARSLGDQNPMVYIQTDASINPGNSGGALVNMTGSLAGLNTFIVSQSGGSEGLGFAIPANTVEDVYRQLRTMGRVHRGEIGVYAQDISPTMARGLSLDRDRGVILADVTPESPGDMAGLKRGDIVIAMNGQSILSASQFENYILRRQAGEKLELNVLRGGTVFPVTLVVRERRNRIDLLARLTHPEKNLIAHLGVLCIEIDKDVAALIPGLRREYGLIVAAKATGGQSQLIDLQPGDIIHAINTLPVAFLDALRSALGEMRPGDPVVLQIERDGHFQYLAFNLDR